MKLQVEIQIKGGAHILNVERISVTKGFDQFIISNQSETQSVTIQTVSPIVLPNSDLSKTNIEVISGEVKDQVVLRSVFLVIVEQFRKHPNFKQDRQDKRSSWR